MDCKWIAEQIIHVLSLVLSLAVSSRIVMWQLGKQHESSLKIERKNKVDELHLNIYENLAESIQKAQFSLSLFSSFISYDIPRKINSNRFVFEKCKQLDFFPILIPETGEDLNNASFQVNNQIRSVLSMMEKYEIALPHFTSLRNTILDKHEELVKVFLTFFQRAVKYLPVEIDGEVSQREKPSKEIFAEIKELGKKYSDIAFELQCFLHDLRIEAQNNLLVSLFERTVEPRKPKDPRYKVLSAEKEYSEVD